MRSIRFGIFTMAVLGAACTEPTLGTEGPPIRTDSAGVLIVESPGPAAQARIELKSVISIGDSEAQEDAQFGRVADAILLANRNLLVLDSQTQELVEVSPDGRLVRTWARGGGGPGELQRANQLELGPDSTVFVFDRGARRVSVFTAGGEHIEDRVGLQTVDREAGTMMGQSCCASVGADASGRLYWRTPEMWSVEGPGKRPTAVTVFRFTPGEREGVNVGSYEGGIAAPWDGPNGVVSVNFSPEIMVTGAPQGFAVGTGRFFGYERRDSDGNLRMIARATIPRIPVTDRALEEWRSSERKRRGGQSEGGPARLEQILNKEHADSLPAYHSMETDSRGWAWLSGVVGGQFGAMKEQEVFVFDDFGRWVGYFRMDIDTRILNIGDEFAVGLRLDWLGRGILEVYPVIRDELGADF